MPVDGRLTRFAMPTPHLTIVSTCTRFEPPGAEVPRVRKEASRLAAQRGFAAGMHEHLHTDLGQCVEG